MTDMLDHLMPRIIPPVDQTRKQLERGARTIATLLARRQRHVKRVEQLDGELAQARKLLRDLICDVASPSAVTSQTNLDDVL